MEIGTQCCFFSSNIQKSENFFLGEVMKSEKKKPEGEDSITSLKLKQVSIEKDVILKFKIQCKNIRS